MTKWCVVRCPYCNRVSIYEFRGGKTKVKRCPYCGKRFSLVRKNEPSWNYVLGIFDNPKDAREFLLKLQR